MIWHKFDHYQTRTVLGNAVFDFTATWQLKLRAIVETPLAVRLIHDHNYSSNDVFFQKMEDVSRRMQLKNVFKFETYFSKNLRLNGCC